MLKVPYYFLFTQECDVIVPSSVCCNFFLSYAGKRTDKIEKSFLASENSVDQIENLKNEEVELFVKYLLYNPQKLHQWLQDNSDMM